MKILLLGALNSMWTLHFVEECLLKNNYEVWMLKKSNKMDDKKYIAIYRKKGIHVIDCTGEVADINNRRNYLKVIHGYKSLVRKIRKVGNIDLINLHYVDFPDLVYAIILRYFIKARLVLSYWGSDLLRIEDKVLLSRGKFAKYADFVTFDNKDLEVKFKQIYKWADKVPSETVLFGLSILDIINEKYKSKSQTDIREKWNLPKDKTIIAVGYNGIPEQQHIKVLKAIEKLEKKYKEKIFLLLQMTYGGTKDYKRQVVAAAKKTGCEYREIQKFLSDDEVADLRIITDIYVNAQTTDAFSGSVCENLFAGTLLLNAKWLCYQEFKMYNFKYLEFERISEISNLLKIALDQKIEVSANKNLIWQLRSWECCSINWTRLFHRLLQQSDLKKLNRV